MNKAVRLMSILLFMAVSFGVWAQTETANNFAPLQKWKSAVLTGDPDTLRAVYSSTPGAKVQTADGASDVNTDVAFWSGLKVTQLKIDVVKSNSPGAGLQELVMQMEVHTPTATTARYVSAGQLWQKQGEDWKLVGIQRTGLTRLQQPVSMDKQIYAEGVDARAEIKEALDKAAKGNKNVIVVFGANWCLDCHVLDMAFHRADFVPVLQKNYEVVHVDIGKGDKNQDLMNEYQVPMKKGIPAVAVLDSHGKLLASQKNGEFENARSMGPEELLKFLNQWKPKA
ncbi:MAG TPA: thioredoxin family protein [Terriglobales bacterium]